MRPCPNKTKQTNYSPLFPRTISKSCLVTHTSQSNPLATVSEISKPWFLLSVASLLFCCRRGLCKSLSHNRVLPSRVNCLKRKASHPTLPLETLQWRSTPFGYKPNSNYVRTQMSLCNARKDSSPAPQSCKAAICWRAVVMTTDIHDTWWGPTHLFSSNDPELLLVRHRGKCMADKHVQYFRDRIPASEMRLRSSSQG